jgi:two-component system, chemotaxis family, chemotaxis protein CheY
MRTILVVEDSALLLQMVSTVIRAKGFEVIEAGGAREALEIMDGRHIDLVITDLIMPRLDGIELTKLIRSLETYKSVPVLMLTTQSGAGLATEARVAGINAWVIKPFHPADLVAMIRRMLALG